VTASVKKKLKENEVTVETEAFPFCSPYLTSRAVMKISAIPALFDFLHPPIRCQRGLSSTPPPWLAARCALQRLYTLLTTTVGFRTCECAPRPVQTPRTPFTAPAAATIGTTWSSPECSVDRRSTTSLPLLKGSSILVAEQVSGV
jgi:hypothetical protein